MGWVPVVTADVAWETSILGAAVEGPAEREEEEVLRVALHSYWLEAAAAAVEAAPLDSEEQALSGLEGPVPALAKEKVGK